MNSLVKRNSLDRVFGDLGFFNNQFNWSTDVFDGRIKTTTDAIEYTFTVPGVKRDCIEITVVDRTLTVLVNANSWHSMESYSISQLADPNVCSADLADGILTVRFAKRQESQPRRIEISPSV